MRAAVTNTVALNGGDAAILLAAVRVLQEAFGPGVEIEAHDLHGAEAAQRYPDLRFARADPPRFEGLARRWYLGKPHRVVDRLRLEAMGAVHASGLPGAARFPPPPERRGRDRYANVDLVLATGGTYLVEHYQLRYRLADLQAAAMSGTPLVLFTQSLGPFRLPENVRGVRRVIRGSRLVLLRDQRSREHLRAIGADAGHVHVLPDAVFALADPEALDAAGRGDRAAERGDQPPRVAVSVREWKHFGEATPEEGMRNYEAAIAAAVTRLVRDRGAHVVFLSTCQGVPEYHYDDSAVAARIAAGLPEDVAERVEVDGGFHDPRELLERLRGFDFTLATRMHMAILSLCAGTPVLPIAYEFKTRELFDELGMSDWVREIGAVQPEELAELAVAFSGRLEELTPPLMRAVRAQRAGALKAVELIRGVVEEKAAE